ncbi:MAG: hypothetical protein GY929_21095 [Actinomycetia bacterium]|nr:hypothetical protein [Actinomycetes bacterium]
MSWNMDVEGAKRQLSRQPSSRAHRAAGDEAFALLESPMAERVLRRALLLEHDASAPENGLAEAALEEVAAELGVRADLVRRALIEELEMGERRESRLADRLVGPEMCRSRRIAQGSPTDVDRALYAWMLRHEGLRARRRHGGVTIWEGGDRQSRLSRGILRTLPRVVTRTRTVADGRQLVEVEGDLSHLRRGRLVAAVAVVVLSLVSGLVVAAASVLVADAIEFTAGFVSVAVLGLGAISSGSAREGQGVADAVLRAVDATCHPELTELNRRMEVEDRSRTADEEGRRPESRASSKRGRGHRRRSRSHPIDRREDERGDDRRNSRSFGERVSGLLEELVEETLD